MEELKLTPSEDLVLETLLARHRLGNQVWTFEKRHARTIKSLEQKGLASFISGFNEATVRASLTDKAKADYLDRQRREPALAALESEVERLKAELASTHPLPIPVHVRRSWRRDPLAIALGVALAADLTRLAASSGKYGLRTLRGSKKS